MFSFFLDLKLPLRCIYKKNREARDMYVNVENVNCKLRSNGMPVPLLRNGYSIFNGTKYR